MREVLQFLKDNKVFFFATMDEERPRVRPFRAVTEFEGRLYFPTARYKDIYQQMKENPWVEISAITPEGDRWVRIAGRAVEDERAEARAAVLADNPALHNMYLEDDTDFIVFYLTEAVASFFSLNFPPYYVVF